ncbi:hypothetical protein JXA32_02435 [Candidatus Sumerlaeota bacterium]|nr:hypothetical protein [Candidatus Sumerlaeota bacterium]
MLLGLCVLQPSIHGHDGILNTVFLRSLWFDHDLNFTNEYAYYDQLTGGSFELAEIPRHPDTGLPMNFYGVGAACLWAPFYAAGQWIKELLNPQEMASSYLLPGTGPAEAWFISLGTLFWATLGLALLYAMLRRRFGRGAALFAIALILLASPLPFYIYFHPSMSHGCAFFAAALLMYGWHGRDEGPLGYWRWGLVGVAGGLLAMIRFQDAALLLLPALGELQRLIESRKEQSPLRQLAAQTPSYALCIAAALLAFLPQMLTWKALQGSPFSGPAYYMSIDSLDLTRPVHFFQIFFSANHGLLYWHPALTLAVIALAMQWRVEPFRRLPLIAALIAHAWIIACWDHWWAGASFGHRMFISILPLLAPGLAALYDAAKPAIRRTLVALLLIAAIWNAGLIVQYGMAMIPREEPVSYRQMLENQFQRLPSFLWTKAGGMLLKKLPESHNAADQTNEVP